MLEVDSVLLKFDTTLFTRLQLPMLIVAKIFLLCEQGKFGVLCIPEKCPMECVIVTGLNGGEPILIFGAGPIGV